jgi:Probable cobalt transporter subunit (CbtB)
MLAQVLAREWTGNRRLVAVAALAALGLYLLALDQGQMLTLVQERLAVNPMLIHEVLHDGRHVLGVPCH